MVPFPPPPDPVSRVAVIGLGGIGSLWDEQAASGPVLSHAGAIARSPDAELVALCDCDPERLATAGRHRGVTALHTDFQALLQDVPLDILSICTPNPVRLPIFRAALEAGVRYFWSEKPLAATLAEAQEIRRLIRQHQAVVTVNFLRRWSPGLQMAREWIASGGLGRPLWGRGLYTGGLLTNGSHLIDLAAALLGPPGEVLGSDGQRGEDAPQNVTLAFPGADPYFRLHIDALGKPDFNLFELDLVGSAGRLTISQKGQRIEWFEGQADFLHPGYRELKANGPLSGDLDQVMRYALAELIAIQRGASIQPACGIDDALVSLRVVEEARNKCRPLPY